VNGNVLLDRLRGNELTLMMAIRSARTSDAVRVAAATGHQAVLIDLEHSAMSVDVAVQLSATAADLRLTPLVRVPEREYGAIGRLLDGGAHGIVFPRIETVEEARTASRACRFPPRGQRSAVATVPQAGMRPRRAVDLRDLLDPLTIVQLLIETPLGVANAEAIAALDGVDSLCIGANDLTAELGIAGEYGHPAFRQAVETVAAACRRHDIPLQVGGVGDLPLLESLLPLGVCRLMLTGTDADLLYTAAQRRVRELCQWSRDLQEMETT
jgi:2-keto-3-deoxy-L-rhamnonate aldolase RhmA